MSHPKSEIVKAEAQGPEIPPCPEHLEEMQSVWVSLWSGASKLVDSRMDGQIVARYIEYTVIRDTLRQTISAEGLQSVGSQGQPVTHPALKDLMEIDKQVLAMEKEMGLTPAARARLGLALLQVSKEQDAFQDFIDGMNQ